MRQSNTTSFSEKTMSNLLNLDIFEGGNHECMLFTSLAYAFFSDLEDPPATNPPKIIIISPMGALLPPVSGSFFFSFLCCLLYSFVLHTNFCNFPWQINVSTWSFRCLHSPVWCSWSWWNLQYLLLSLTFVGAWMGLGHCRAGSSFICINTCSIGITRGVKLVNLGLQSRKFFFLSNACLVPHVSFILSGLWLVPLSLSLLVVTPLAITASFAFIFMGLVK